MYAEEFILIPRKTYDSEEKTVPQPQVLHYPSIYLSLIIGTVSRTKCQPRLSTNIIHISLTAKIDVPKPRKWNLIALTIFKDDNEDKAEKNDESDNKQLQR